MQYNFSIDENKSKFHALVINLFREKFSLFQIAQEMPIQIDDKNLFIDVVIKNPIRVAIEINPSHHFEYTPFFHKSYNLFLESQNRDKLKKKWCELNNYLFIELLEEDFKKDNNYIKKIQEIFT